jgi:RNA recognition motif-containing protein
VRFRPRVGFIPAPPTSAGGTSSVMEEGTRTKKTVFVGGIGDDVDESVLLETFSAFGVYMHLCARNLLY